MSHLLWYKLFIWNVSSLPVCIFQDTGRCRLAFRSNFGLAGASTTAFGVLVAVNLKGVAEEDKRRITESWTYSEKSNQGVCQHFQLFNFGLSNSLDGGFWLVAVDFLVFWVTLVGTVDLGAAPVVLLAVWSAAEVLVTVVELTGVLHSVWKLRSISLVEVTLGTKGTPWCGDWKSAALCLGFVPTLEVVNFWKVKQAHVNIYC